jgi:O-antigen/teichoic acid export membrane protein
MKACPSSTEDEIRVDLRATRLSRFTWGRSAQTIFDQLLVSASNFLTGIILVRGLGLVDFGKFTIGYVLLLLANSIQLSFISSPMITLGSLCAPGDERARFVRGVFGIQVVFCAVAAAATVAVAITYMAIDHSGVTGGFVLPFAASVAAFLMQDWLRRYYFTVGKAAASIWNDALSYVGQVIVLFVLWASHLLTINSAFWTIAATSGLAFLAGAAFERLGTDREQARDAWRRTRGLSVDLGIANQLQWLVYQGAILIGAGVAGPRAAGGVRATQNVIGPVNVAFQAMENIVPIRAAEEMRRGGIQKAAGFLFRFGAVGFIALLLIFSAASLVSGRFLAFFYGRELRLYAAVLNLQMLYFLLAWPIRQLTFLLRTIENTRPVLLASVVAAVMSLSLVYPLVRAYGALGIVMAAVGGQIGNLVYLVVAWTRVSSSSPSRVMGGTAELKS